LLAVWCKAPSAAFTAAIGGLAAKSADFSCNPGFNISQLGAVTRWTPVKNLTFSAEVVWTCLDQKFTGAASLAPTSPKPATIYEGWKKNLPDLHRQRTVLPSKLYI
jgi:hypothetical protein